MPDFTVQVLEALFQIAFPDLTERERKQGIYRLARDGVKIHGLLREVCDESGENNGNG